MKESGLLENRKVLVVDDEKDVLDTVEDLLSMCVVKKASTFEEGKTLLETQYFDIAILDIMGVDGYKLLEIATERKVLPVMLTAHALTPEDTVRSFKEGAAYYVPKDNVTEIATYLNDILEAREQGKSSWWRWLERFVDFYNRKFGPNWQKSDIEFWKNFGFWE